MLIDCVETRHHYYRKGGEVSGPTCPHKKGNQKKMMRPKAEAIM